MVAHVILTSCWRQILMEDGYMQSVGYLAFLLVPMQNANELIPDIDFNWRAGFLRGGDLDGGASERLLQVGFDAGNFTQLHNQSLSVFVEGWSRGVPTI